MRRDGVLLIAMGGGVGALVRYLVGEAMVTASFPWATFAVNVLGCALLAVVGSPTRPKSQQRVLGTGFCGGLTTFSTFAVEIAELVTEGRLVIGIVYLIASVVIGLGAYILVRQMIRPGPPTAPLPS